MNTEFIKELCGKINLSDEATSCAFRELSENAETVESIVNNASLNNIKPYMRQINANKKRGAVTALAAALAQSERIHNFYLEKGIPDEIFYDTMGDISVWTNNALREENIVGLLEMSWVRHSIYANLFKIGRLQYQFFTTNHLFSGLRFFDIINAPIKDRARVLNIHIPQGGRLDFDDCVESLREASEFFAEYFPEYDYKGFVCDSWLLDKRNVSFMNGESNIIKFSGLFDKVVQTRSKNYEIVRRLWGTDTGNLKIIENLPEETDLQRRTKKYLLSGGKTGNGYGFIEKSNRFLK